MAAWYGEQVSGRGEKGQTAVPAEGGGSGWSTPADEYNDGDTITGTGGGSCTRRPTTWPTKRTTGIPEVHEPGSESDGQEPVPIREQMMVQVHGNGPGGRGLHVPKGFGQNGPPGYIMPHEERRGPMPHQGGWQVQLHPYGPGPPNPQKNDDHLGDVEARKSTTADPTGRAHGYQRASLEAKVHDLQRELEQQAFRTPER